MVRYSIERWQTQKELRVREQRLNLALDYADVQGWEWYVQDDRQVIFGKLLSAREREEWGFESFLRNVHPDDVDRVRDAVAATLKNPGNRVSTEYRLRQPDGLWRWVVSHATAILEPNAMVTRVVGVNVDITEQKRQQLEMEDSRRLLEQALLQSKTTGWTIDLSTGALSTVGWTARFSDYNSYAESMQAVAPEFLLETASFIASAQLGEPMGPREIAMLQKDGTRQWLEVRAWPVFDSTGQVSRVSGVSMDITERKAREQQEAQQARLRALGTMASGIAHDFNNALSPIVAFAELLQRDERTRQNPARVDEYLGYIVSAAKEAAGVVSRMREFYRPTSVAAPKAVIDVEQLVKQALSVTAPAWKDQALGRGVTIQIVSEMDDGLPFLVGNPNDLQSALTNLLVNAVDSLDSDGVITLFCHAGDGCVELGVRDTGKGMTRDDQQHALEPFFTTKGEKGTGLGLPMVYGAVQRHDGTLLIDSSPGVGTTVTMRLPAGTEKGDAPATESFSRATRSKALHALIVDDELAIRTMLAALLEADGHQVELAEHGLQALEKLRSGSYDLLITDRSMPIMNGDQLAAAVKTMGLDLPIIMLTGFGELMASAEESVAAVDVTLAKPVSWDTLRVAIQQVTSVKHSV
ncbi:MAG: response regulator [Dehalococcoidia bacterium]|nr:response regulator [Dehalococcoidia bacterium]